MRLTSADPRLAAVDLDGRRVAFGSSSDADVVIAEEEVTATHAVVVGDQIEAMAECLVGGVPLRAGKSRRLVPGVSIQIGSVCFAVETAAVVDTRALAFQSLMSGAVQQPTIIVVEAENMDDRAKRLALTPARVCTIGRSESCDLTLADTSVSRVHLSVEESGGRILLRDEGATGGVFLGAARLAPGPRAKWPRDRMVRIGHVVLGLLLPVDWEEIPDAKPADEDPVPSTTGASSESSIPSLRIASSSRAANIASVEPAEVAPVTRARSIADWMVPAAVGAVIVVLLAGLAYIAFS